MIADYVATLGLNTKGAIRGLNVIDKKSSNTASSIQNKFTRIGKSISSALGNKRVSISLNTQKIKRQIANLKSRLSAAFTKSAEIAKRSLLSIGGVITSLTKNLAVTGIAIGGVGLFAGNKAIEEASDLNESINAVNKTFGDSSKTILDFGKNADKAVGLSQSAFNDIAINLQSQLANAGLKGEELNQKLIELVSRSADIGSLRNVSTTDVLTKITAALRGEADPIESLGVIINANALQQQATALGISKAVTKMNEAEKIQLRLAGIIRQTNKADGDFQDTAADLANAQKILGARYTNIAASIGDRLLPIKSKLITAFGTVTTKIEAFLLKFDSTEMGVKFNAWVAALNFDKIIEKVSKFIGDFDFSAAFDRFKLFIDEIKVYADKLIQTFDKISKASSAITGVFSKSSNLSEEQFEKKFQPKNQSLRSLNTSLRDGGGRVQDRNPPSNLNTVTNKSNANTINQTININGVKTDSGIAKSIGRESSNALSAAQ